ncbi:MAG: inositol monophosphatase [Sphingobacteriaceae bacterium]|nr:inositol monophosphatase [Sphingobacteriaceae bacterium]
MMDSVKLNLLLAKVIATCKDTGHWILNERNENFRQEDIEIKGLNDLVSYVDKGAESKIVKELNDHFPAGFIVEENSISSRQDYNWIVDPLDGTTNFIHGIPCYAVSIALEFKGEIILGVVYEINKDECFYATKDGGSFLNSIQIRVSENINLKNSLIATGFPIFNFSRMESYLKSLKYFMENTHGIRRMGSAAVDLCYVACGRFDGFYEYNLNAWDVAAGALIVKEAGGIVSDFKAGNNWLFDKEIIASNDIIYSEFLKSLNFSGL